MLRVAGYGPQEPTQKDMESFGGMEKRDERTALPMRHFAVLFPVILNRIICADEQVASIQGIWKL